MVPTYRSLAFAHRTTYESNPNTTSETPHTPNIAPKIVDEGVITAAPSAKNTIPATIEMRRKSPLKR